MSRMGGKRVLAERREQAGKRAYTSGCRRWQITSVDVFVSAAVHATKQRWNATGSSLARMMPNWSCEGVPFL